MNLSHLEPKAVWKNFAALNAYSPPSKKEEKVIAFIKDFGKSLDLETSADETGNVIIRKPATPGMESRKTIILQSHLDMVCQKNNDTDFDFDTQGINMLVDGDWVKANGTTLGADNGIGVAAIMSILESSDIAHPAIEALFTIDEETGMTGAFGLKPGVLHGDILLNLDTEEDDEIDIGCAGGMDVTAAKEYNTVTVQGEGVFIEIKGLMGGHSGMDIDKGIGRGIQLCDINAGGLRNAIPREAKAKLSVTSADEYLKIAETLKTDILNEYKSVEKKLTITIGKTQIDGSGISISDSEAFIKGLKAAHNGVYRMSPDVKGLVESSNNIARVELKDGKLRVLNLSRSSVDSTINGSSTPTAASF
ncbi:hypothetical protein FQR65_LT19005 [Abscondita terminalis]|nr:hypothetical protein FQR65_LT19005 [Abscondita terminalis]